MKKYMRLWIFVYFIFVICFATASYYWRKNSILTGIEKKLENSANMVPIIAGDDFLKNAYDSPLKNSESEIWKRVYLLTKYCQYHQIISTTILGIKKKIFYILISGLDSPKWKYNLEHNIRTKITYNYNYSTYKGGKSAKYCQDFLKSNKNQEYMIPTDTSEGFSYIILFKRFKLPNGRLIVTLSAIYLSHIDQMLFVAVMESLFIALFFSLIGIPFAILLKEKFKLEKKALNKIAASEKEARDVAEKLWYTAKMAKLKAERANNTKNQFFANMSHDFRTPLNAILGFSNVLLDESSAKSREYVRYIDANARYMLNLTEGLLDFAKLEANQLEIVDEVVNLKETSDVIYQCFSFRLEKEEKKLEIKISDDMPITIESNNRCLFQIINNLITNSLKFTQKNDIITINFNKAKDEKKFEIIVRDTGTGMSEKELPKIFTKFYKSHAKSNGSGTGLGLYIVKTLIRRMNGTIKVESEKDKYTQFCIKLPLKQMEENLNLDQIYINFLKRNDDLTKNEKEESIKVYLDEMYENLHVVKQDFASKVKNKEKLRAAIHSILGISKSNEFGEIVYLAQKIREELHNKQTNYSIIKKYHRMIHEGLSILPYPKQNIEKKEGKIKMIKMKLDQKILIVDDNLSNILPLQRMINRFGNNADYTTSGFEALEMIKDQKYDIMFIDLNMPEMSGTELLKELQKLNIEAKFFAYTADVSNEIEKKLLKLGFDEVFEKPILSSQLIGIFHKLNKDS